MFGYTTVACDFIVISTLFSMQKSIYLHCVVCKKYSHTFQTLHSIYSPLKTQSHKQNIKEKRESKRLYPFPR